MKHILKWHTTDPNIFAYIKPNASGSYIYGKEGVSIAKISDEVKLWDEDTYETNFEKMRAQLKNEYGLLLYDYNYYYNIDKTNVNIVYGYKGAQGVCGLQGAQGMQGPMGPQGPKGDTYSTAVVTDSSYVATAFKKDYDYPDRPSNLHETEGRETGGGNYDFETSTYTPPTGWYESSDDCIGEDGKLASNEYIFRITKTFMTSDMDKNWTYPIMITGQKGEDSETNEYIYKLIRSENYLKDEEPPKSVQIDGDVPSGWNNHRQGVTEYYRCCISSFRFLYKYKDSEGNYSQSEKDEYGNYNTELNPPIWSDWSQPIVDSTWGKDGSDGDGVEYIFTTTMINECPKPPLSAITKEQNPEKYAYNESLTKDNPSGNTNIAFDEWYGYDNNGVLWNDDPETLNGENGRYQWVSLRKSTSVLNEDGITYNTYWKQFGQPSLWNRYISDAEPGTSLTIIDNITDLAVLNANTDLTAKTYRTSKGETVNLKTGDCVIVNGSAYIWDGDSWMNCGKVSGKSQYLHIKYASKADENGYYFTDATEEEVSSEGWEEHETGTTWDITEESTGQVVHYKKDSNGKVYIVTEAGESTDGAKYIGTLVDDKEIDSTATTDYTWAVFRGEDGMGIEFVYTRTDTNDPPTIPGDSSKIYYGYRKISEKSDTNVAEKTKTVEIKYDVKVRSVSTDTDKTNIVNALKYNGLGNGNISESWDGTVYTTVNTSVTETITATTTTYFTVKIGSTKSKANTTSETIYYLYNDNDFIPITYSGRTRTIINWSDDPKGVSNNDGEKYEWQATRKYINGYWNDFSNSNDGYATLYSNYNEGTPGETGTDSPILYPAGMYASNVEYTRTSTTTPYVKNATDNKYYVLIGDPSAQHGYRKEGNENPVEDETTTTWPQTYINCAPKETVYWLEMEGYSALFADYLIADNGTVGSAVFNGHYMFSQYGYNLSSDTETTSSEYKNFFKLDPYYDNIEEIFSSIGIDIKEQEIEIDSDIPDNLWIYGTWLKLYETFMTSTTADTESKSENYYKNQLYYKAYCVNYSGDAEKYSTDLTKYASPPAKENKIVWIPNWCVDLYSGKMWMNHGLSYIDSDEFKITSSDKETLLYADDDGNIMVNGEVETQGTVINTIKKFFNCFIPVKFHYADSSSVDQYNTKYLSVTDLSGNTIFVENQDINIELNGTIMLDVMGDAMNAIFFALETQRGGTYHIYDLPIKEIGLSNSKDEIPTTIADKDESDVSFVIFLPFYGYVEDNDGNVLEAYVQIPTKNGGTYHKIQSSEINNIAGNVITLTYDLKESSTYFCPQYIAVYGVDVFSRIDHKITPYIRLSKGTSAKFMFRETLLFTDSDGKKYYGCYWSMLNEGGQWGITENTTATTKTFKEYLSGGTGWEQITVEESGN